MQVLVLSSVLWNTLFKNSISDNSFDKKQVMSSTSNMALAWADKVLQIDCFCLLGGLVEIE